VSKEADTVLHETGVRAVDASQALFNRQLATYRKVTRANLMYHREVYGLLREALIAEAPAPFRFLDIACGDASASAEILRDLPIAYYYGIDLSALSLDLATQTLRSLPCQFDLRCRDFVEAMADWRDPIDVVWIGMSLHHLQIPQKLRLMTDVHQALQGSGIFLIWEPTCLDGEGRAEWLDRFASNRPTWAALTNDEFAEMESHMRLADFPEKAETWMTMGHQAGFAHADELYAMPNRFGRVFKFWN
jgi:SAM-dependent methyltransferase